jgi:hypothetical protein
MTDNNQTRAQILVPEMAVNSGEPMRHAPRHHVLRESMEERSGRLFFREEPDFEIPDLMIYAAR